MHTDGTGFNLLHSFTGGASDGAFPLGSLTLSGSTLYGMTQHGGNLAKGTLFKIDTDGTGFGLLESFAGFPADGASPKYSDLTLSDDASTLYGMTEFGGSNNVGVVFSESIGAVPEAGTALFGCAAFAAFALRRGRTRTPRERARAVVALLFVAYALFGLSPAQAQLTVLHSFSTEEGGFNPRGGLVLSGGTLYGTTSRSPDPFASMVPAGTVFSIHTDGTALTHMGDVKEPVAPVLAISSKIYGTSSGGGFELGNVFSMDTNGAHYTVLKSFDMGAGGARSNAGLTLSGDTLYGAGWDYGSGGAGSIFKLKIDGTGFQEVWPFADRADGAEPWTGLVLKDGTFYGVTRHGGIDEKGVIYKVNTDGTGFSILRRFTGTGTDGAVPYAGLTLIGDTLYGTTTGGDNNTGTIFKINTDGTGYAVIKEFGGIDGAGPASTLLSDGGDKLFGTTIDGGSYNDGALFEINVDGTGYNVLANFDGSNGKGPQGDLALSGDMIYGTTEVGGAYNAGVLYTYDLVGPVPEPSTAAWGIGVALVSLLGRRRHRMSP